MSESKDYWRELLGDDYNEELMNELLGPDDDEPKAAEPAEAEPKAAEPAAEVSEDNFVSFDLTPAEPAAQEENPQNDMVFNPEPVAKTVDKGPEGFEVDFDFEGEYKNIPNQHPIRVRREKRTGCMGGILYALFIICVSIVAACFMWMAVTDVFGFGKESRTIEVTIPEDYDEDSVTELLYQSDIIKYKRLFKLYIGFSNAIEEKIAPGTYQIMTNHDYFAIVNGLSPSGGVLVETDYITIPEGYTLFEIFELLEDEGVCTADKLWDAAQNYDFDYEFLSASTIGEKYRLEGYLFPDTYKFYVNDEPVRVIEKFLDNFDKKLEEEYRLRAEELGYSINEILTIASMIEREAANDEERDKIASVIYNRLDNPDSFPLLQIDATIYYAIQETGEAFATDVDSPYNTYMYEGLPPGPIANPGIASIRAALYPQDTDYYFYALHVGGYHEFFSYQSSFEEFVYSDEYGG